MWVALAAVGILGLADYSGGSLDPVGVAFALAAGALWAAYIVLSQRTGAVFPGGSGLAIAMVAGAVLVAPFGIADAGADLLQPELFGVLLAVAIASSVLPYSLEIEALRTLPQRVFGVLMSLEPALAALAGFVVLGQDLALRDWIAISARRDRQRRGFYPRHGESVESPGGAQPARPDFLRAVTWVECGVVGSAALLLLTDAVAGRPGHLGVVTPPLNARYVGVIYLAALVALLILAVPGRWSPGRLVLWVIFVFTDGDRWS